MINVDPVTQKLTYINNKLIPSVNNHQSKRNIVVLRADKKLSIKGSDSWYWLVGEDQILNIPFDFEETNFKFLTTNFISPPITINSRSANISTKTGWCRFNVSTPCNFQYCVDIPFKGIIKYMGAYSGDENTVVAIIDDDLVEITMNISQTVQSKLIFNTKKILESKLSVHNIQFILLAK